MRRGDYGCGPVVVAGVWPLGPRGALAHTGLSAAQSSERRARERDGIQRVSAEFRRQHQFDTQCVPSLLIHSEPFRILHSGVHVCFVVFAQVETIV